MTAPVRLIVGLGNPGPEYEGTRHNAGFWFIDHLARELGVSLRREGKFAGETARAQLGGHELRLLKPETFMNRSGQSVAALANFFKIPPQAILVAHDELDFEPGVVKLKQGGGHGGHNGLRDIIARLGNQRDFLRLRIGIGHPGDSRQVTGYVLGRPPAAERQFIEQAIEAAWQVMPLLVEGEFQQAVQRLHSR